MAEKTRTRIGPKRSDPLAGYHGLPLLGSNEHSASYLGRVILELYDIHDPSHPQEQRTDANNLRYTVGPTAGLTANELVERFVASIPHHFAKMPPLNLVSGPLADYKQPIIGEDGSDERYLGRIVVELYSVAGSDTLRYSVDTANNMAVNELIQRITAAFTLRAKNQPMLPY